MNCLSPVIKSLRKNFLLFGVIPLAGREGDSIDELDEPKGEQSNPSFNFDFARLFFSGLCLEIEKTISSNDEWDEFKGDETKPCFKIDSEPLFSSGQKLWSKKL